MTKKERDECRQALKDARDHYDIGDFDMAIYRMLGVLEKLIEPRAQRPAQPVTGGEKR